jgi:DNA-nicking Smr family endonuclease
LSEQERALWRGVTQSIDPLRRVSRPAETPDAEESPNDNGTGRFSQTPRAIPLRRTSASAKELPLAPLERRFRQRLARGVDPLDARIDLHGRTQREAHAALMRFLRRAQADGAKTVLVITGKGGSAHDAGHGVLRRQVPLWLELPEFRPFVLGFESAAITHGGEGALYVRVRRARSII